MTIEELAREAGLYAATWAPGERLPMAHDRHSFEDHRRYRFFVEPTEYFSSEGLFTLPSNAGRRSSSCKDGRRTER